MKEIIGNLWDYYGREGYVVCITTNGMVRKDGAAVMGRGCAREAAERFPGLAKRFGAALNRFGNRPLYMDEHLTLLTFPVKHAWYEDADLLLIEESARWLAKNVLPNKIYVLPRPGCGNGRLTWAEVKPALEFLPDNIHVISRGYEPKGVK